MLLDRGAAIDARDIDGWTPLHRASLRGHVQVVRVLLDDGASVVAANIRNADAFYFCMGESFCVEIATILRERGADVGRRLNGSAIPPQREGFTAMHRACQKGL